ncbi:MAG: hypothetical protein PHO90_02705 [Candidatus Pacebacteria bacterium]|nr:hypothetical protein [Candidatus Paceibacterota bacterium]
MIKSILKFLFLAVLFYVLYFLQMSFLPFFSALQFNFVVLLVLIINIFEDPKSNTGLYCAFFAGVLSDIFSPYFFGLATIILLSMSILIKFILLRYVRLP